MIFGGLAARDGLTLFEKDPAVNESEVMAVNARTAL
jgi:hypothetical protein